MHFEVLTEDRSGGIVVESLMQRILATVIPEFHISIRPHRGKGDMPDNLYERPERLATGLLDLLPAKLRAYDRVYAGTDFVLVVVMDSDNLPPDDVREKLLSQCRKFAPSLPHVIGICVEETEAWLLADVPAILAAYPDADMSVLRDYKQDSVCGTWEVLCTALLRENAPRLIRVGYPAIGQYKQEWSTNISKNMDPNRNISPSFLRFAKELVSETLNYEMSGVRS